MDCLYCPHILQIRVILCRMWEGGHRAFFFLTYGPKAYQCFFRVWTPGSEPVERVQTTTALSRFGAHANVYDSHVFGGGEDRGKFCHIRRTSRISPSRELTM